MTAGTVELGPAAQPVIEAHALTKRYDVGTAPVMALDGVDLSVEQGEFVAIVGASGSGKSTLMNVLGCLDVADSGSYHLAGQDVALFNSRQLAWARGRQIGFVFQSFNLVSQMTALANVALPMVYAGVPRRERLRRASAALEMLGLANRARHKPTQLSGGQAQRLAIARALVNAPSLILADEPTGNLDSRSAADVLDAFEAINQQGRTVVLITHDQAVAARAGRVVRMSDGRISQEPAPFPGAAAALPSAGAGHSWTAQDHGATKLWRLGQ